MTSQGKDVVQRAYHALASGNFLDLLAGLDDQVEWREPAGFGPPLGGIHQGPTAAVRDVFGELETRWPGYQLVPAEYLESGDDVIVLGHTVLPDGSDEPVGAGFAHVWRVRDGRIVDVRVFTDTAIAMRHTATAFGDERRAAILAVRSSSPAAGDAGLAAGPHRLEA